MYRETEYLTWANRLFGTVEYNLAKGGAPSVPLRRLGPPPSLDDPDAWTVLRRRIARYNGLEPEQTLPALGTTHALWLAFAALLRPGDEVLVETPGYEPLWRIPEGMGAHVIRFARSMDEGFEVNVSRVEAHLTARTRLVVMTNLHNPSGVRTNPRTLRRLADRCEAVGARLLVDEVYAPYGTLIEADGVWGDSARHVAPNIIAVSGLSKAYGLGALRVGWLCAEPEVIRAAEHAIQSSLGDPPIAQSCIAAHALASLPELSATQTHLRESGPRDEIAEWIAARPHLRWHAPKEGPFGFIGVSGIDDLTATIERGAAEHGVLVAPGAFFGEPSAFRLGWSVDRERLPRALAQLDRTLRPR